VSDVGCAGRTPAPGPAAHGHRGVPGGPAALRGRGHIHPPRRSPSGEAMSQR
jgi:hypothetical protein